MEQQIIAGLMARGLSEAQAKGVVANMIAESRLNPGINEIAPVVPGSRGGYGLNQWTGPRRRQYEEYAQTQGAPLDDMNTQLDFTMWELQNTERRAGDALRAADDPVEAARVYSQMFLRPGVPHMDRRMSEAARLAGLSVGPAGGPIPGRNALAQQQQPEPITPQNALAAMGWKSQYIDPAMFMRRNKLA